MLVQWSLYMTRQVFTIAILDMVKRNDTVNPNEEISNLNVTGYTCGHILVNSGHAEADFEFTIALDGMVNDTVNTAPPDKSADIPTPDIVKYNWSEKDVGSLQSAYFIGYLGTMIVGVNILLKYLGFFHGMLLIMILNIVATGLFPMLTTLFGFYGALAARLLLGCAHGPITSLIAASMYSWVLPTELTSMNALANIGGGLGLACSGVLAGLMIDAGYSWKTVYYVDTILMIIPFCVFFAFGDDAPEGSASPIFNSLRPFRFSNIITEKETELIVSSRLTKKSSVKRSVPWGKLVLDRDIWLFSTAWFLSTFAFFSAQFLQPRLFQYLIFVDLGVVTKVGTMVSFIGMFGVFGCSIIVDKLRERYESQAVRKGAYAFFSLVTILLYGPVATFPCQQWVSLFLVIFANFGMGLVLTCATKTIPNEMGGEFSGQVYAVTNTFSNMAGVVGPYILGYFLDLGPMHQITTWYPVFAIAAGSLIIGSATMYFGNYGVLSWAQEEEYVKIIDEKESIPNSVQTSETVISEPSLKNKEFS